MNLCDLNPYLRFAAQMHYDTSYDGSHVRVSDCRLFYVLAGSASLNICGKQYALSPGDLFYCCAGSSYQIQTRSEMDLIILNFDLSRSWSHQALPISPVRDSASWSTMEVFYDQIDDSAFLNGPLYLTKANEQLSEIEQLLADHTSADRYGKLLSSARLKTLLIRLHSTASSEIPAKVAQDREYILANYANPITNQELAALAAYHEYYLNRIFTAATGQSLHSYLLNVRLQKANHIILNTDTPLQEIPELVGFGSYPHFSAAFKQQYGLSPAQYRKNLRANI